MPKLSEKLATVSNHQPSRNIPLWKGPSDGSPMGGITQSMLQRFLVCRERFRLKYIEGLQPAEGWSHRLGYGNMWHACEEAFAAKQDWLASLTNHTQDQCKQYPTQQELIDHWYRVCKTQFPIYVEYWKKHPDVKNRTPLLQEAVFNVPYTLPSGRTVHLRGKWDAVDLIGPKGKQRVFLQENKAHGDVDEQSMKTQLSWDHQTMMYLIALRFYLKASAPLLHGVKVAALPLAGVRYNVIRRPLSGGKGSIKQHKPTKKNPNGESKEAFYKRLGDEVIKPDPAYFFFRWEAIVTEGEILRYKQQTFIPMLEQLCDWWDYMKLCGFEPWDYKNLDLNHVHWRHPYGIYNVLNEGGVSDIDEYLTTGSTVGLQYTDKLFTELQ